MQHTRLLHVIKNVTTPLIYKTDPHIVASTAGVIKSCNKFTSQRRDINSTSFLYDSAAKNAEPKLSFITKFLSKFRLSNMKKYRLMTCGCILYEKTVETVDYSTFYKEFRMTDTFYSWYLITELHVWMLMCRLMADGKDGKLVRNVLVETMWADVQKRTEKLGPIVSSVKRTQLNEIYQQFNGAIINYDEGIMSDDKVLAGAIWRRFFNSECSNPLDLEQLVIYVRKQINMLDRISSEDILFNSKIKWLPLEKL